MRENRTSGSEGGETGQPVFPTPILAFQYCHVDSVAQLLRECRATGEPARQSWYPGYPIRQ